MKKTLPLIIVLIVVVAGLSFYGGMKYGSSKVGTTRNGLLNFNNLSDAERQQFQQRAAANRGFGVNFISGEIINKDDTSLTVKLRDGGSKIVFYSNSTEIGKIATGTSADLVVGTSVTVNGKSEQDGSLAAETIQIRTGTEPFVPGQPAQPLQ